jgi:hypothetical protein
MNITDLQIDATLHPAPYARLAFGSELTGAEAAALVSAAADRAAELAQAYTADYGKALSQSDEAQEVARLETLAGDHASKADDLQAERDRLRQATREAILTGSGKAATRPRLATVEYDLGFSQEAGDILGPAVAAAQDQLEARRRQLAGEARSRAAQELQVKREQLLAKLGEVAGPVLAELLAVQRAEQSVMIEIPL